MRAWRTIYKKELVDTLRDRRTLATMLLVPMVGYPIALLVTSETIAVHQQRGESREVHAVIGGELPPAAIEALEKGKRIDARVTRFSETSTTALEARVRELLGGGDVDVVIMPRARAKEALLENGTAELTLYYDVTASYADAALSRVEDALGDYGRSLRDERMRRLGVAPTTARPIALVRRSVSTDSEVGNNIASSVLPALVLLFIAISCFYPAVDLTAGEKERKTLATLLTAPVRPMEIVIGKYLAVVTVGTIAGLLNVLVLGLTLIRVFAQSSEHASAALAISPLTMIALLFCVFLIALPIGALMLLTATLARSFRDASTLLTPVLLVATVPAVFASMPGFELTPFLGMIPLANAALLMKALVMGKASASLSLLVVASTVVATALLLFLAGRIFTDERVLFSTEGRRADLRSVLVAPPPIAVSTALALAGVVFVANYYGSVFGGENVLLGVVITQLLAHAVPAVVLAQWMRRLIDARALLSLRVPGARFWVAALLLGAGAWLGVSIPSAWFTSVFVPGQEQAAEAFRAMLGIDRVALPAAIGVLAVLPAIAEELLFRGALLGLLVRSLQPRTALIMQAVLFGLMHGSIFRLVPTGMLGLLLGVLALRSRSIWPGVIAHAMTNTALLVIDRLGPTWLKETISAPTPFALAGLALVALALYLSRGTKTE